MICKQYNYIYTKLISWTINNNTNIIIIYNYIGTVLIPSQSQKISISIKTVKQEKIIII